MNEEIIIPLSKLKMILIFLGALGFAAAGGFMITGFLEERSIFLLIIGLVAILFFGAIAVSCFVKLFDTKPGLIINQQGIIDNSTGVSIGLINWKDITGIRTRKVESTRFLLIDVKDANKYLDRANSFKRKILAGNQKVYGTPISIPSNAIKCNFKELEKIVTEAFEKYKTL